MPSWFRLVLIAATIVSCVAACEGGITAPAQASVALTMSPDFPVAADCSPPCQNLDGGLFRWRVNGTLTIQETSGIGGNVESITVTNLNPPIVFNSGVIVQRAGTNRLTGRGTLVFPIVISYGPVNAVGPRRTVIDLAVSFADDRGNHITASAKWSLI